MPVRTPTKPFTPMRGLAGPHAQTVLASFLRRPKVKALHRERWRTEDGDFFDVDFLRTNDAAPTLLVFHGMEGSSKSGYVAELLRGAAQRGWNAAALNFRSCSGDENQALHSYSSGDTRDPRHVVEKLTANGKTTLFAAGFSLGGNVLLKLLAELGDAAPIAAAAAIGVPFDLASCARSIDAKTLWSTIYRERFLRTLKAKALRKAGRFPDKLDARHIATVRDIRDFDTAVTARIYGYRDSADYYANAASLPVLPKIRVPTLLVYSKDDPIAPPPEFPAEVRGNSKLHFLETNAGGHVGFMDGTLLNPGFWAEREALAFFDEQQRS